MRRLLRAKDTPGDEGMAMIMVIGIGSVISILLVAGIAYSVGGMKAARSDQDWNAAIAAAYAGIEEYQSQLADDPTYLQYGNPDADFSSVTGSDVELPPVANTNPAFGVGESGPWAPVAGSGGAAEFRYEVNNADYPLNGNIKLRTTGRVGNETRTIVAELKQQGFIDFLYFTDYEILDPDVSSSSCNPRHRWVGTRPNCTEIAFGQFDSLNGPMHSNDSLQLCGTFYGKVSSSNPSSPWYTSPSCTPTFNLSMPEYRPAMGMPPTNSQIKKETRNDLPKDVPRPGCLYTGPTSIKFNNDGTMTVRSPWTLKTRVSGEPASAGTTPSECGTLGTGTNRLGSVGGQTLPVPENNVIYVQNIPSTSTDPNYRSNTAAPASGTCKNPAGSNVAGNGMGYPISNETAPYSNAYLCRSGDAFVEGILSGKVTVAAENFIYVVDDIVYDDAHEDMLGLIGNNAVWVFNPMYKSGSSYTALRSGSRQIDAAILSVAHTFMVQNYNRAGKRGTLTVNGAIAQKFRGTVATGSGNTVATGFAKDYNYDSRFWYTAPPKFLSPVTTTYGVNIWVEVSPVMDATGEYR